MMQKVLMLIALASMLTVGVAFADKEPAGDFYRRALEPCGFTLVTYNWDFSQGDQGFTTVVCDDTGGLPT